jgi:ubiquinone/menaquinone biosynthesis C-methylase UbiE
MNHHEPGKLEVWMTVLVGKLFGRSVYEPYVDSLGLRGDERVLDFGSGAGTPARLLARKLVGGGQVTCVDISQVWLETARKRLARFPNVAFKLGEIFKLDIADASHDVVFIHFVIHDIPASQRQQVVNHLARKLVIGGKLYVREPLNVIGQDEIRRLLQQSGLTELKANVGTVPLMGTTYEGTFGKEEQDHA